MPSTQWNQSMRKRELTDIASGAAKFYDLDRALVCALCEVESDWNPWMIRLKPSGLCMKAVYVNENWADAETEQALQQFAFGLMQFKGNIARERDFDGWLTELCDPRVNLEWGCRHLRWMIEHAGDYGIEMIGNSPGAFGQHTPPAHTAYQGYDPNLPDLAAAWNGGAARFVNGKYANQSYVDRVVRAMEEYQ